MLTAEKEIHRQRRRLRVKSFLSRAHCQTQNNAPQSVLKAFTFWKSKYYQLRKFSANSGFWDSSTAGNLIFVTPCGFIHHKCTQENFSRDKIINRVDPIFAWPVLTTSGRSRALFVDITPGAVKHRTRDIQSLEVWPAFAPASLVKRKWDGGVSSAYESLTTILSDVRTIHINTVNDGFQGRNFHKAQ